MAIDPQDTPPFSSGHLILVAIPAWGHLRPLCAFACRVIQERPEATISLLTVGDFAQKAERELDRYFSDGEAKTLKTRIRVVSLGGTGSNPLQLMPLLFLEFLDYYKTLTQTDTPQATQTSLPNAAIIDFFAVGILQAIRTTTGTSVPVFAWTPATVSVLLRMFGPEHLGGLGDVSVKARKQAKTTGRSLDEITGELYRPSLGEIVTVPGLPPMYDYEWFPQESPSEISQSDIFKNAHIFIKECDGIVSMTSSRLEQQSVEAIQGWLLESGRQIFTVGPLIPPGVSNTGLSIRQKEIDLTENGDVFQSILDKTLQKRRKIYLSIYWWPPRGECVWVLVDILLELILSHPSPHAVVAPEVSEKVTKSGLGLLSAWSPQQTIFDHPATDWFVTHCGQNSVIEAMTQSIPMIAWPMSADQPANAAYLTLTLDIAYELLQVRTGLGLKPLYRGITPTGTVDAVAEETRRVLESTRGPEGKRKRKNVKAMRDKLRGEWVERGAALMNLRKLLVTLIPGRERN